MALAEIEHLVFAPCRPDSKNMELILKMKDLVLPPSQNTRQKLSTRSSWKTPPLLLRKSNTISERSKKLLKLSNTRIISTETMVWRLVEVGFP